MSASLVIGAPQQSGPDRFQRFLWISMAVHLALGIACLVVARWPREAPRNPPLSFQLVGAPPRGPAGPPSAPAPAPEASSPETPAPPEPATPPPPLPSAAAVKVPAPPVPNSTKPPAPAANSHATPAPSTATSSAKAPSSPLPVGPLTGQPTGDTLSVGGQGGVPTVMTLWLSRVKFQVERNWSAPPGLVGVVAAPEVVFEVARDGRPSRPVLRVKSGNAMLDRLALRAVSAVELFPPVPPSWQGQTVAVRYVLEYAH